MFFIQRLIRDEDHDLYFSCDAYSETRIRTGIFHAVPR